jgi:hypothetical protein
MTRKLLISSCALGVLGVACILLLASTSAAVPALSVTPRAFPKTLIGALPYDVDTERVGALLKPLRQLQREGKIAEADAHLLAAQREFDITSWQAFLALNWPVAADENPSSDSHITSDQGQPRWSFWRPSQSIFLPNGAKPSPWDALAAARAQKEQSNAFLKTKAAWRQEASPEDNFQAFSGPLVDQNGKWARYEALVNHEEFDYIVNNTLYNLDGQVAFTQRDTDNEVDFPANVGTTKHGAIEIKLSWKEMGANDDVHRFYTMKARVRIAGPPGPDGQPQYRTINAGLVGMHISMRTASSQEWIWATFEQIDNVRQNPLEHGGLSHANFMNPALKDVPVNVLPAKNAVPEPAGSTNYTTWYESLTTTPVQVARIEVPTQAGLNDLDARIASSVAELNKQVQAILHQNNSVFQYYELIGTQWPVHQNAPAFAGGEASAPESIANKTPGDMIPTFLTNTTMETYFQKGLQKAGPLEEDDRLTDNSLIDSTMVTGTESCVGCHYSAGICVGFKKNSDGVRVPIFGENTSFGKTAHAHFSWMLQLEAQSPDLAPASATPRTHKSGIKPNVQP